MQPLFFTLQDLPGQESPRDPLPSPSTRRRWGGIFTAEYLDEYVGQTSPHDLTWRAALRIVKPKLDSQQRRPPVCEPMQEPPAVSPNLRWASLTRSNAVCNRRSRSSRFGIDSLLEECDRNCGDDSGGSQCLVSSPSDDGMRLPSQETRPVPHGEAEDIEKGPFPILDKFDHSIAIQERLLSARDNLVDAKALMASITRVPLPPLPPGGQHADRATKEQWLRDSIVELLKFMQPDVMSTISEQRDVIESYNHMLSPLLDDFNSTRAMSPTTPTASDRADAFEEYLAQAARARKLVSCIGEVTVREILLLKSVQQQVRRNPASGTAEREAARSGLDVPLDLDTAIRFSRSLSATSMQNTTVKMCAICHIPKFINAPFPSPSSPTGLTEFHPDLGTTTCCSKSICRTCLPGAFASGITTDWWDNLGQQTWLKCPIPTCASVLPIRYNVDLTNMLRSVGDPHALLHVMQFDRANLLRAALEGLPTQPSRAALIKAAGLHNQLARHARMRGFFDVRMLNLKIELLPIDTAEGQTLDVPIFTGLLLRRRKSAKDQKGKPQSLLVPFSRDCIVCAETIADVVDGTAEDDERWAEATVGFPGEWQLKVRSFPPPSVFPECGSNHEMDICRTCIARHLDSQLETLGRAACDRLSCPAPDCGHTYTDREVRLLASPETYAKLDKFRLLNHLATLPNFRWCLREGCASGQIYEIAEASPWGGVDTSPQRISCEACGYDMCFAHQEAWHFGLSCEARDTQKAHGDPDIAATRLWIAEHTKPCPGPACGVPVEKKGGCFHMTCSTCRYEFCWECLANWSKIQKGRFVFGETRRYDRKGHNAGCYFRAADAQQPTMLMGNGIQEALARY